MDEFNSEQSKLLESFANARKSESDMIDAVLLANGREFPIHTFILSMRSDFFKTFFRRTLNSKVDQAGDLMRDENKNEVKGRNLAAEECLVPTVFQIDQDPKVLEKILQFIYVEESCKEFSSLDQAKAILVAANQYHLTSYEKICGSYLASKLTTQNFVELHNLGILLNNKILLEATQNLSCEDLKINIALLIEDAFQDYFKRISKNHPNEAIL